MSDERGASSEADGGQRPEDRSLDSPPSDLRPPPSDLRPLTSTGLEPRMASALAYLAGPFSGALMLFAETANDDVRFHAWQSIIGIGGVAVAILLSYMLAFGMLFVSATAVTVMFVVASVLWVVLLIAWAMCLFKAYTAGPRWKLPIAGDYAERRILGADAARAAQHGDTESTEFHGE